MARSERGQVSIEYIGFFMVIAVVMLALTQAHQQIADAFETLIIDNIQKLF